MLVTVCTAVLLAGLAFGNEGALVLSHTGAPVMDEAPEQTCSTGSCHGGGSGGEDDGLLLEFSASEYSPGDTVNLTVTVTTDLSEDRFGFQVTGLNPDLQSAGTFDGPNNVSIGNDTGRDYVSAALFTDESWEFNWTVDDYYGDMTFWITAIAYERDTGTDSNVTWARSFQLTQHNRAPSLSNPQVMPDPASESDTLEYVVTYTDPDGDEPDGIVPRVYIDGSQATCDSWSWDDESDITAGREYTCSLDASIVGVGNHDFYFGANDSGGAAANDTELQTGPFINDDPVLSQFGIDPSEAMYPDVMVNVTVVYTDANDQVPSVWICVNNCSSDNRTLDPADWDAGTLSDGDYANGELFFLVNTFPVGNHTLTAGAHDTLNMSNPLSGDLTVRDDIPRLSNAMVSPASGGVATSFNFTVVFTDFDNRSGSVSVNVGGMSQTMSANGDGDTSNGEEFYWNGTLTWGSHSFNFSADNGLNDAVDLSGGSVMVNDAPAFGASGTAERVGDTYTFTANVSDINEEDGDSLTVSADLQHYGALALSDNSDGTYSATLDLSVLIEYGGTRTVTFSATDSTGVPATGDAGTASFFVDYVGDADMDEPADASGTPGDRTITFTIVNGGNADDTYNVSASSFAGWSLDYPATVSVAYDSFETFDLTVTVPNVAMGVMDELDVGIVSQNDGTATDAHTMTYTVAQAFGVAVTAVSSAQEGAPGSSTTHTFTVQNTGNGDDTFAISTGGSWSSSASSSSLALAMGQVALVTVTHDVPAGAAHGDSDTVTLNAVGGASGSAPADSSAGLVTGSSITLDTVSAAYPGDLFQILGTVTNIGNGDATYSFGISGNSEANGWASLNTTSTGEIAAGADFDFRVWIDVPEDTPAGGSYSISVATGDDSASATIDIANDARSVSVSAAETSFRLNPGASATTVVTVTNTGSVATDYTLVADDGHDYVRFSTTSFNVAKGGFQTVQMTVIVPSDASGALSAGFTVSPLIDGSGDSLSISINPNLPQDTSGWAMDTAGVDSNTQFTFTLTGLAGAFTIDWDFGDGSAVRSDGGLSQSHAYATSGAATVSLTVTDDLDQVTSFSTASFEIANAPPDVSKPSVSAEGDTTVDGDAVTTVEGTEVEFVQVVPSDSDGSLTLLRVDWGDGTHRAYSGSDLSGPTLNLGHTYWEPGTYQVSVTAVDNSGDETVVQAQEVTVLEGRTVLEEGTNQLGLLLLLAVFGLALSATAYHIRKQGFSGDEAMNEQERARLSTLEQRMDTVREREELLEVAAYDAARVTTKLEDHIGAFNAILVKAQEIAAKEKLAQLEAEEAAAAAAETQRELDLTEPDLELLAERFHGTLGKLVETRTELGHIEEQLAYVLKMERDEQFEKLTELTESYESTRRKIEALENIRVAREQAREESNLMDLLGSKGTVAAEDDFSFADDEDDDTEEYEVEIYEDEDGSFYYIDPDSGEEVPCDEDGNPL